MIKARHHIWNLRSIFVVLLAIALIISFNVSGVSAGNESESQRSLDRKVSEMAEQPRELGEILIGFREGMSDNDIECVFKEHGYGLSSYQKLFDDGKVYELHIQESDSDIKDVLRSFIVDDNVIYAEPNYILSDYYTPNDPGYTEQYAMWNRGDLEHGDGSMNARAAWDGNIGNEEIIVAIVDSGIDYTHDDLKHKYVEGGYDYVNDDWYPLDDRGHGTHVAGIAAADTDNGIGVAGVAGLCPNVKIMAVKFTGTDGTGPTSDAAEGIRLAVEKGARVINMSFGSDYENETLKMQCEYAYGQGCYLVAAAGNYHIHKVTGEPTWDVEYPAKYECVTAVANVCRDGTPSGLSCLGPEVDICAPGQGNYYEPHVKDIYSTMPTYDCSLTIENPELSTYYSYLAGTSMSAPHVAGAAAFLLAQRPELSPDMINYYLKSTAYRPPDFPVNYGDGILDLAAAVNKMNNPAPIEPVYEWYFPEGSTAGFEEWLGIQNKTSDTANVGIEYMLPSGNPIHYQLEIPPESRRTVSVHEQITNCDVSARVYSDKEIYAERSMYWANRVEGHDCHGLKNPSEKWFLPEGCVGRGSGFNTFVLIQNPNDVATVVHTTFQTNNGPIEGPDVSMPARSRRTINLNDELPLDTDVSTTIDSDLPVFAERSMYWGMPDGGSARDARGGTCSLGIPPLNDTLGNTEWFCAEGSTSYGFDTYILIQNPNNATATINLTYMTPEGKISKPALTVPAKSRHTVRVNDEDQMPNTPDVSTMITSNTGVVVERAMYWNSNGPVYGPGHSSEGARAPSTEWYLAEGTTAWGFETWVLIQNPDDRKAACVELSYMTPGGSVDGPVFDLPAGSRRSINIADTPEAANKDASTLVISDMPIIVERSMYWASRQGGTSSVGMEKKELFDTPAGLNTWVILPEGEVTFGQVSRSGATVIVASKELPEGNFPGGYSPVNEGTFYHVATSAEYSGDIELDLNYHSVPEGTPASDIRLYYYLESINSWIDVTTGVDESREVVKGVIPKTGIVCAAVPDNVCPDVYLDYNPDTGHVELGGHDNASGDNTVITATEVEYTGRDVVIPPYVMIRFVRYTVSDFAGNRTVAYVGGFNVGGEVGGELFDSAEAASFSTVLYYKNGAILPTVKNYQLGDNWVIGGAKGDGSSVGTVSVLVDMLGTTTLYEADYENNVTDLEIYESGEGTTYSETRQGLIKAILKSDGGVLKQDFK